MIRQEPSGAFRAAFLLTLGGTLGLAGLILLAGRTVVDRAPSAEAPQVVAAILAWGPRTLLGAGACLAAGAAFLVSVDWLHRRA